MPITFTIPNTFAARSGNVAASELDADFNAIKNAVSGVALSSADFVGAIVAYGGSAAPSGWLLCDGAAVSRTTFSALFAVCGTQFGAGDGSTTFNVPNLKGRVVVGIDAGQTEFDVRGETGGSKTLPNHLHTISHGHTGSTFTGSALAAQQFTLASAGSIANLNASNAVGDQSPGPGPLNAWVGGGATTVVQRQSITNSQSPGTPAGTVTIAGTDTANSGNPTTNPTTLPPYIAVNYLIKT